MKRKPTSAEIYAAELKVSQSMQQTHAVVERVRTASHAAIERVAAIALVVGVVGLPLIWLARRRRSRAMSSSAGAHVARNTSVVGLVLAFLMRYGQIGMPFILQQLQARRARSISSKSHTVAIPKTLSQDYTATGWRH